MEKLNNINLNQFKLILFLYTCVKNFIFPFIINKNCYNNNGDYIMKKTKLICTIGPSSIDDEILIKALEKIMPSMLVASANNYVKCDLIRPGRADSACYHIAKMISQYYEASLGRTRRKKAAV